MAEKSAFHTCGLKTAKVIQQTLRHANVTITINIYVKMVTEDAEEAIKRLESKCSPVVPQLPFESAEKGPELEHMGARKTLTLEAVRGNLAEHAVTCEPFSAGLLPANREKYREFRRPYAWSIEIILGSRAI